MHFHCKGIAWHCMQQLFGLAAQVNELKAFSLRAGRWQQRWIECLGTVSNCL
jgi:hypothetical protein